MSDQTAGTASALGAPPAPPPARVDEKFDDTTDDLPIPKSVARDTSTTTEDAKAPSESAIAPAALAQPPKEELDERIKPTSQHLFTTNEDLNTSSNGALKQEEVPEATRVARNSESNTDPSEDATSGSYGATAPSAPSQQMPIPIESTQAPSSENSQSVAGASTASDIAATSKVPEAIASDTVQPTVPASQDKPPLASGDSMNNGSRDSSEPLAPKTVTAEGTSPTKATSADSEANVGSGEATATPIEAAPVLESVKPAESTSEDTTKTKGDVLENSSSGTGSVHVPLAEATAVEIPEANAPPLKEPIGIEALHTEKPEKDTRTMEVPIAAKEPPAEASEKTAAHAEAVPGEEPQAKALPARVPEPEVTQTEVPPPAPELEMPEREAPSAPAPETEKAPSTQALETEIPQSEAPPAPGLETEMLQAEATSAPVPEVEVAQAEPLSASMTENETPQAEAPTAPVPETKATSLEEAPAALSPAKQLQNEATPAPASESHSSWTGPLANSACKTSSGTGDSTNGSATSAPDASTSSSDYNFREQHGRRYHAYRKGVEYGLPNDEAEQDRLEMQHYLMKLTLGNDRLHASPTPSNLQEVLDIGTGTGAWAVEFAERYPSATVTGTDISPVQAYYVPPNCHFLVEDAEGDWSFPREKFDFIHGRMIMVSMKDWPRFFERCYAALKPGGWLELQDMTWPARCDDGSAPPDHALFRWSKLMLQAAATKGVNMAAAKDWIGQMQEAGFEEAHMEAFTWPIGKWPKDQKEKDKGMLVLQNYIVGMQAFTLKFFTTGLGWSKEQVDELVRAVQAGVRDRRYHMYLPLGSWCGKKPENAGAAANGEKAA